MDLASLNKAVQSLLTAAEKLREHVDNDDLFKRYPDEIRTISQYVHRVQLDGVRIDRDLAHKFERDRRLAMEEKPF